MKHSKNQLKSNDTSIQRQPAKSQLYEGNRCVDVNATVCALI